MKQLIPEVIINFNNTLYKFKDYKIRTDIKNVSYVSDIPSSLLLNKNNFSRAFKDVMPLLSKINARYNDIKNKEKLNEILIKEMGPFSLILKMELSDVTSHLDTRLLVFIIYQELHDKIKGKKFTFKIFNTVLLEKLNKLLDIIEYFNIQTQSNEVVKEYSFKDIIKTKLTYEYVEVDKTKDNVFKECEILKDKILSKPIVSSILKTLKTLKTAISKSLDPELEYLKNKYKKFKNKKLVELTCEESLEYCDFILKANKYFKGKSINFSELED